jgi:hypothetical protein
MENQKQATVQGRDGPDTYRTTARAVGVLFLAGMVAYGGGNALVAPGHDMGGHLRVISMADGY